MNNIFSWNFNDLILCGPVPPCVPLSLAAAVFFPRAHHIAAVTPCPAQRDMLHHTILFSTVQRKRICLHMELLNYFCEFVTLQCYHKVNFNIKSVWLTFKAILCNISSIK